MKKSFKLFLAIICSFVIICNTSIFAANVNISANTSVELGNNVTINISVPGVTGKCTVTSSNPNVVALSAGSVWIERGTTSPIVGYTKGAGSATITVTPNTMADDNTGDDVAVSAKSITINVKEKYVPPVNNNTNNNTNTNTNNNNNVTTNNKVNTNTNVKSSNTFLSKLQVNVEGLTPNFNKNKYSYTLALNEKVDSVNVTAVAEDSKAKVSVSGNTNLKEGDNTISIVVTAENGAKKTYTIIATKSTDLMKSDSYLANLIIEDCQLTPEFSSEIFEYDLGNVSLDKLNVFAYPKNENAKVEITGNKELVDGENIIKIKITSENGATTKEYTLKVKKDPSVVEENVEVNALVDEGKLDKVSKWEEIKKALLYNWLIVILFVLVIVEFIQILYLYCKYHNVKVTVPWKENKEENVEEKNSWFKKLNKENADFEDENIQINEKVETKKEDIKNQVQNEIENEIPNDFEEENQEEISYEEIMSKINELSSEIDNKIQDDIKDESEIEENIDKRTRNGRKE